MVGATHLLIFIGFTCLLECKAFYKFGQIKNPKTYIPKSPDEVKKYLCMKTKGAFCDDDTPRKIIINRIFDFTATEGITTERGCYHAVKPERCKTVGQMKLNVVNQCNGLTPTDVKFGVAGRQGIKVGSNKIIIGMNGGGFKGKGLRLENSKNVEIRNVKIIEINPHVIWGGDALDLINVDNVLIDNCYIKNIGRQMLVTHFGQNKGVMISNSVFDGSTPNSAYCNGQHYWLWLLLGMDDMITFQNNVIKNTNGRGPHIVAQKNSKSLVHFIQNTFYDVTDTGLIDLGDKQSSILLEGNVFVNVSEVVHANDGNIFLIKNENDEKYCLKFIGRLCLRNTIIQSGKTDFKNSDQVLIDFQKIRGIISRPIDMRAKMTHYINIPDRVKQHILDGNKGNNNKTNKPTRGGGRGRRRNQRPATKPNPRPAPKPHKSSNLRNRANKGNRGRKGKARGGNGRGKGRNNNKGR